MTRPKKAVTPEFVLKDRIGQRARVDRTFEMFHQAEPLLFRIDSALGMLADPWYEDTPGQAPALAFGIKGTTTRDDHFYFVYASAGCDDPG
jgi:hypothetical protein